MHQNPSFELPKPTIQHFFIFFTIRWDPWDLGGLNFKATPKHGRKLKKEKLFQNQHDKTNTKMGGRSLLTNFGFIGRPLRHCTSASLSTDFQFQGLNRET